MFITGAEETSLYLFDDATHRLELTVFRGTADRPAEVPRQAADDSVVRQVLSTGKVAMIQAPRSLKTHPLQARLAVPLKVGDRTIGVLQAFSEEAMEPFTDNDRYLLSALADYAAIAVENARLYEAARSDLAERKRAEETIRRLAYHDALTGLPNRTLFKDRLGVALAQARRKQQKLAVMLLDLDHFKNVNDRLGHTVGDQLLQAVGVRLTGLLRESDTVCRMGGDEFLLLLPEMGKVEYAGAAAARILEIIRKTFVFEEHRLRITTSLGIAIYPDDGEDGDTLIKNADAAMYRAKEKGRDNYQRYCSWNSEK
jgi:diguanylate cyclase (GGDEF)-like protein